MFEARALNAYWEISHFGDASLLEKWYFRVQKDVCFLTEGVFIETNVNPPSFDGRT